MVDWELDRGTAELVCPSAADKGSSADPSPAALSGLRSLSIHLSQATLDMAAMPGLASIDIWVDQLAGSGSLAAASALTDVSIRSVSPLILGRAEAVATHDQWVASMLRTLPPGLANLSLRGRFLTPKVAAALASAASPEALSVTLSDPEGAEELGIVPAELGPGPLWHGLRALRWDCWQPLPQVGQLWGASLEHHACLYIPDMPLLLLCLPTASAGTVLSPAIMYK